MAHNSAPRWQSFQFRFASLPRLAQSRTVELTDIGQCCLCHFFEKIKSIFFTCFLVCFFGTENNLPFFDASKIQIKMIFKYLIWFWKWSESVWFLHYTSYQTLSPSASKNAVARTRVVVLIHDHSWCSIKSKTNQKLYDTNGQHNGRFSLYKINKKKMSQDKPPPKRTSEYKIPSL